MEQGLTTATANPVDEVSFSEDRSLDMFLKVANNVAETTNTIVQDLRPVRWVATAQAAITKKVQKTSQDIQKIEIDFPKLESVTSLGFKEETRELDTPAYQDKKEFVGYKLADVLKKRISDLRTLGDLEQYKVTFVCADGYQSVAETTTGITTLAKILVNDDFLATGNSVAGKWDAVDEGHMTGQSPAPFYIMGESMTTETWPLQVVKIVIEKNL